MAGSLSQRLHIDESKPQAEKQHLYCKLERWSTHCVPHSLVSDAQSLELLDQSSTSLVLLKTQLSELMKLASERDQVRTQYDGIIQKRVG